jgi:hypothetical protein
MERGRKVHQGKQAGCQDTDLVLRSADVVARYAKMHIRYDVLLSGKLRYPGSLWSAFYSLYLLFTLIVKHCYIFFVQAATAPSGPGPPHYRRFMITLSQTHHSR